MPVISGTKKIAGNINGKDRPTTIQWKGHRMVRNHSFLSAVKEIIRYSAELDVVRIGLIGDMHSGKSTLSQAIAHAIHKHAEINYNVKILYKNDLLNFEETMKSLKAVNHILIFDDVSFMGASANKQQIEMVKQAITTIRHMDGGQDVKIIVMMNYHYLLGLDKYLRSADFKFITTVGSSEGDNMEKMVGSKHKHLISQFKNWRQQALASDSKKWFMPLGRKNKKDPPFAYTFRDPFIPVLFWNESSLRFIVTPTRQFIDKHCGICDIAEGGAERSSDIDLDKFFKFAEDKFGTTNMRTAVKLYLWQKGEPVFAPSTIRAHRWLGKAMAEKFINLGELAEKYEVKSQTAKNHKVKSADEYFKTVHSPHFKESDLE